MHIIRWFDAITEFYVMLKKISHVKLAGFHSNLNLPKTLHHDSPLVLESYTLSPFSSTLCADKLKLLNETTGSEL